VAGAGRGTAERVGLPGCLIPAAGVCWQGTRVGQGLHVQELGTAGSLPSRARELCLVVCGAGGQVGGRHGCPARAGVSEGSGLETGTDPLDGKAPERENGIR